MAAIYWPAPTLTCSTRVLLNASWSALTHNPPITVTSFNDSPRLVLHVTLYIFFRSQDDTPVILVG